MKNLIGSTIEKIKAESIKPEPRWKYLVKNYGIWSVFGLIVFLSAISVSVSYHLLSGLDWDLHEIMHQSMLLFVFSAIPFFWIVLLCIFIFLAFVEIRKTKTGYRFSVVRILLMTFGMTLVAGVIMSVAGFGGRFNRAMNGVPYYAKHTMSKEKQWMQPEKGLLSGKISEVSADVLLLEDLTGNRWSVRVSEKTLIRPMANIEKDEMIKIVGTKQSAHEFIANEIRPWMGRGMVKGAQCSRQRSGEFCRESVR